MSTIPDLVRNTLTQAADALRGVAGLPGELAEQIATLAHKVEDPCVVAVVGRVKAGKSTFINALLGAQDDLATVGTIETTATINYFRYGRPADPARPVRCYYRSGHYEDVDAAFLNRLQGNDLATLQRAEGIQRLEYRLELEFLRRVTLVDTPGTGAVVSEHGDRTDDYMGLYRRLRERHDQETQTLGETADATPGQVAGQQRVLPGF
jgi:septin family protein